MAASLPSKQIERVRIPSPVRFTTARLTGKTLGFGPGRWKFESSAVGVQKCLICKIEPSRAFNDTDIPPYGATMFTSPGHYGSTVWDPFGFSGDLLQITICDACLVERQADILIRRAKPSEVMFEYLPWIPGAE